MGKLVVACLWSVVCSTELDQLYVLVSSALSISHHKITVKVTRHNVKHINNYIELIESVSDVEMSSWLPGMFSAAKIQRSCPVDPACMCCL